MQVIHLKLGGAALNQTPLDWAGNLKRIQNAVAEARGLNIELLCLPELCLSGYGCEDMFLADWVYERCEELVFSLLPASEEIAFTVGLPVKVEGVRYNAQALLFEGKVLGLALKHHLANSGVYYEPRWFSSWPLGKVTHIDFASQTVAVGHIVFSVKGQRIAFEICEDGWRADQRLAHHYKLLNVDVLLNPSASHFVFGKEKQRHHLADEGSRIIEGAYVYVNLLGNESGRLVFDGDIVIYRNGTLMTEAERCHWGPRRVLPEGRIEQNPGYLPAEAEYEQAATLGLYDYMRKSRSKGFCLSLSGGADSACCAILVHRMGQRLQEVFNKNHEEVKQDLSYWPELVIELGKANSFQINKLLLACLYQSTENSSDITRMAARAIAENIGCFYEEVDITPQLKQYTADAERIIGRNLSWEKDDLALQNIQARVRAPMIWYWTNLRGSLLLTTSNRSEGSVGYSTMDGDMAGGIAPIAGVSKDFVRSWLVFAEKALGYPGLSLVNALQPTAELRPLAMHQTDEKDLMPYSLLDQIENLLISTKKSENEALSVLLLKGEYDAVYLKTCISRFMTLWRRNQWKRERLAPSFHLDTYNIDPRTWCRYPILSGE